VREHAAVGAEHDPHSGEVRRYARRSSRSPDGPSTQAGDCRLVVDCRRHSSSSVTAAIR
jgi:hypothetical protein